jgi:hypothetical protein
VTVKLLYSVLTHSFHTPFNLVLCRDWWVGLASCGHRQHKSTTCQSVSDFNRHWSTTTRALQPAETSCRNLQYIQQNIMAIPIASSSSHHIGASLLNYIQTDSHSGSNSVSHPQNIAAGEIFDQSSSNNNGSSTIPHHHHLGHGNLPTSTRWTNVPCMLLDYDDNNENNNTSPHRRHRRHRIWLDGPAKSGKTSLAMNFAYAIAATAPSFCTCLSIQKCRCVTCVIYRPYYPNGGIKKNNDGNDHENDDLFPLFCERSTMTTKTTMMMNDDDDDNNNNGHYWDPNILQRIRIHRVRNKREILDDLLSILGRPLCEQPHGAIVIDGLDQITNMSSNEQDATVTVGGGSGGYYDYRTAKKKPRDQNQMDVGTS